VPPLRLPALPVAGWLVVVSDEAALGEASGVVAVPGAKVSGAAVLAGVPAAEAAEADFLADFLVEAATDEELLALPPDFLLFPLRYTKPTIITSAIAAIAIIFLFLSFISYLI
jgi:hypothetical protein